MADQPSVEGVAHSFIRANGIEIHVARAGAGEPLILLHGWPEFWYVYHKLIPLLSPHFDVIVPDLRGFGQTEKPYDGPTDEMTPAVLADDLEGLADALGLARVGLISQDFGANVAQHIAYNRADRRSVGFIFNIHKNHNAPRWMAPDQERQN